MEGERLTHSQGYNRKERETGQLAKKGDREEERLTHSKGYNRKERDRLAGKGGRQRRRETE